MDLASTWDAYRDLAATKPAGMGPSPITFLEIDAYQRTTLNHLSAWQVRLIRQLDDVILAIARRPGPDEGEVTDAVSVDDPQAVKTLFRRIGERHG